MKNDPAKNQPEALDPIAALDAVLRDGEPERPKAQPTASSTATLKSLRSRAKAPDAPNAHAGLPQNPRHHLLPESIDYANVRPRYSDSGEDFYDFLGPLGQGRSTSETAIEVSVTEIQVQRDRLHGEERAYCRRTEKAYQNWYSEIEALAQAGHADLRTASAAIAHLRGAMQGDPFVASPLLDCISDPIARGKYLERREAVALVKPETKKLLSIVLHCAGKNPNVSALQTAIDAANQDVVGAFPASVVSAVDRMTTDLCDFYDKLIAMKDAYREGVEPSFPSASEIPARSLVTAVQFARALCSAPIGDRSDDDEPLTAEHRHRTIGRYLNAAGNFVAAAHLVLSDPHALLRDMDGVEERCWGVLPLAALHSVDFLAACAYDTCDALPPSAQTKSIYAALGRLVTMHQYVDHLLTAPLRKRLPHEDALVRSYD